MNTIFINSENSRIPDPHRLLLNLTDNIDLRRKENIYVYIYIYIYIALSHFSIYCIWSKGLIRTINSKFHLQHGMKIFNII